MSCSQVYLPSVTIRRYYDTVDSVPCAHLSSGDSLLLDIGKSCGQDERNGGCFLQGDQRWLCEGELNDEKKGSMCKGPGKGMSLNV